MHVYPTWIESWLKFTFPYLTLAGWISSSSRLELRSRNFLLRNQPILFVFFSRWRAETREIDWNRHNIHGRNLYGLIDSLVEFPPQIVLYMVHTSMKWVIHYSHYLKKCKSLFYLYLIIMFERILHLKDSTHPRELPFFLLWWHNSFMGVRVMLWCIFDDNVRWSISKFPIISKIYDWFTIYNWFFQSDVSL